jgi:hypothetical protein
MPSGPEILPVHDAAASATTAPPKVNNLWVIAGLPREERFARINPASQFPQIAQRISSARPPRASAIGLPRLSTAK